MPWAKVLRSGQVTFPKEVREALDLKEGDIVDFRIKGSEVTIRPKIMVDKEKADAWKMLDDIHNKMKGTDPEKIEKLVEKAIREVRKGKITAKTQKK